MSARRIRIGIDTGGTFTDVVAFDEDSGELVTTKTPSTPGNPADGFIAGIEKILDIVGAGGSDITRRLARHDGGDQQAARGQGRGARLHHHRGLRVHARDRPPVGARRLRELLLLGQARPHRPGATGATVGGRLDFTGAEIRPFDEEAPSRRPAGSRTRASPPSASASSTPTPTTPTSSGCATSCAASTPTRSSPSRSEVLREYREYERVDDHAGRRGREAPTSAATSPTSPTGCASSPATEIPFYVMKSNGGVLSADEVVHQPITTVLSGPAAGALGAALIAQVAGFDRILTCDGGGTSTDVSVVLDGEPTLTTEGTVGAYPSKIPMIDVVTVGAGGGSIAWLSPEGTLKVGPQLGRRRPRPALLRPRAAPSRPSPTPTSPSAGSLPTCSAARSRSTWRRPGRASPTSPSSSASTSSAAPPASWRSRPGTRPTPCGRSASSAASTSATSC